MKMFLILFSLIFCQISFASEASTKIIESEGLNFESILRGLLGIIVLVGISILLSNNRKKINWKTASAGLGLQLILAICILKLTWVQNIFEFAGKIFIKILDII